MEASLEVSVYIGVAITGEEVVENGEGTVEGGSDNGDDKTQGEAKAKAEGDANDESVGEDDGVFDDVVAVGTVENLQDGAER